MATNKFAASCANCGIRVEAGKGNLKLETAGWRVYCPTPCERRAPAPAVKAVVGDLSGILALFAKARSHLQFPCIVIGVPAVSGLSVRLNVAGEKAREPGSLTVVNAEKAYGSDRRDYLGNISKSGTWTPSRGRTDLDPVLARLREFAAEPARIAAEHGRLTGRCCFCDRPLKDERSTAVGYGATCADHFGLPWGSRPAEFAGEAA